MLAAVPSLLRDSRLLHLSSVQYCHVASYDLVVMSHVQLKSNVLLLYYHAMYSFPVDHFSNLSTRSHFKDEKLAAHARPVDVNCLPAAHDTTEACG